MLELIDGLQRVSSLITFITGKRPGPPDENQGTATKLIGCDILLSLNGLDFASLDGVLQLELKRKTLRAIVIRRTNDPNLRYEMFKRLNSGGSPAEAHEIRNASLRIVGEPGEAFLSFLNRCAEHQGFQEVTDTLSDQAKQRLGREELVLRFFALKISLNTYKGSISDWLDDFSEAVVTKKVTFQYQDEEQVFTRLFTVLAKKFGDEAFVKHKTNRALGGLAPAYYDAVTIGLLPLVDRLDRTESAVAKKILNQAVGHENEDFRENVGPGANEKGLLSCAAQKMGEEDESGRRESEQTAR